MNHQGKMFLNPGDEERYNQKRKSSLEDLITEGKLIPVDNIIYFEVTDKCLKSELQV